MAVEKNDYPPVRKPPAAPKALDPTPSVMQGGARLVGESIDEKLAEIDKLTKWYVETFGPEWRMVWRDTVKISL